MAWFVSCTPSLQEKPQEPEEVISESSSEEVEVRNLGGLKPGKSVGLKPGGKPGETPTVPNFGGIGGGAGGN